MRLSRECWSSGGRSMQTSLARTRRKGLTSPPTKKIPLETELSSAVYELLTVEPHARPGASYAPGEWLAYQDGYCMGVVKAWQGLRLPRRAPPKHTTPPRPP